MPKTGHGQNISQVTVPLEATFCGPRAEMFSQPIDSKAGASLSAPGHRRHWTPSHDGTHATAQADVARLSLKPHPTAAATLLLARSSPLPGPYSGLTWAPASDSSGGFNSTSVHFSRGSSVAGRRPPGSPGIPVPISSSLSSFLHLVVAGGCTGTSHHTPILDPGN